MNSLDFWERFLSLMVALMAGLGGPIGFLFGRRQRNAEASKVEADAGVGISSARKIDAETLEKVATVYRNVITDLEQRMDKMEEDMSRLSEENGRLRKRVDELEQELRKKDAKIEKLERHVAAVEKKADNGQKEG